jgi:hypothetical protein
VDDTLIHMIARGGGMSDRSQAQVRANEARFRAYVQDAARSGGGSSSAEELRNLAELRDSGATTADDHERAKVLA